MNNTKIIIQYSEVVEIQRNEETKIVEKEYHFIPLEIIKAIEILLDSYKNNKVVS